MPFDTNDKTLIDPYNRVKRWALMKKALKDGNILLPGGKGKKPTGLTPSKNKAIYDFLIACERGETSKRRTNAKVGHLRLLRIVGPLVNFGEWYPLEFFVVDEKAFKKMLNDLDEDKIKQANGKPYKVTTKTYMKKLVLKFWRWLGSYYNNPELFVMADKFVRYEDIELKPDAESKETIWKLSSKLKFNDCFTIRFLFDGGFRATESLNIRFRDVKKVTDEYGHHSYLVNIRHGTSKTQGRSVSVALCTKDIDEYFDMNRGKLNSTELFIPHSPTSQKLMLYRTGMKYLNKPLSVTFLRHCSMTYYAPKIKNSLRLTTRYGEAINSRAMAHYIKVSGVLEEETAKEIKLDEQSRIRKEHQQLTDELSIIKEKQKTELEEERKRRIQLEQTLSQIQGELSTIKTREADLMKIMMDRAEKSIKQAFQDGLRQQKRIKKAKNKKN